MVKLSEEQCYKLYRKLDKDSQRKVLQCVGADIGAFVGTFEIDTVTLKEIVAKKIEATICRESLKKYVEMLLKLRGDIKMKNLKLIENELVPVYETSTGEKVVYGSELHLVLGSKTDFSTWIKRRFNDCEAIEKEDYTSFPKIGEREIGATVSIEYIIKLDTAKEMAMLERNEKGKEVRKYFIDIEKKYKTNNSFKLPVNYEAIEKEDYTSFPKIGEREIGATVSIEYIIKLDTAKEMAMLERNEKGKEVRKYFIDIEKKYKTNNSFKLPVNYIEALEKLVERIEEQAPKVDFANAIAGSETSILIRDMAKILKQNGINIGEKKFFKWLRENKYLISQKGESYNTPSQTSMNLKIMEIKENIYHDLNGEQQISKTPVVTGKGQQYFINKFLRDKPKEYLIISHVKTIERSV